MDPRLLRYYNRELQHMRDMGAEFASEFPKIAGRLGIEGEKVADPYVERLLEGFAFLAARVHLKIDDEFPNFTQHLLDIVYPHYLNPMPAMAVARFNPVLDEGSLAQGFLLPRNTVLHAVKGRGQKTACEFRTGHDVKLWPIEITDAKYFGSAGGLSTAHIPISRDTRAGLRVRLRATAGVAMHDLSLDMLRFYLHGKDGLAARLYEQILGQTDSVVIRPKGGANQWHVRLLDTAVKAVGFERDQSLLPFPRRSFDGYRILQEYFGFPERFLFFDLSDLQEAFAKCSGTEIELVFLLKRRDAELERLFSVDNLALNCAPIINLFPKRADRVHLKERDHEYHIVPDATRPMDYEVWSILELRGFGSSSAPEKTFSPMYSFRPESRAGEEAYFSTRRVPRALSAKQRKQGGRSSYVGSEVYVSLADSANAPIAPGLRQIEASALCTNRDLALHIPTGQTATDFTLDTGAPVESVTCLAGPTRPRPSYAHGDIAWRLIGHLSLNYLSLVDSDEEEGAKAMRSLLNLYIDENDVSSVRQIEGLKSISSTPVTRRLPTPGPVTFGRGIEITLTCEEGAFEGVGLFPFGQVMQKFLGKYVSLNSFTETVLVSGERGEIMRWPAQIGQRPVM